MCLNSRKKSQLVQDFAASKRAIKENENAETFLDYTVINS